MLGSDTYVLDDRLFAVPIHGSNSYCSLCKTRKPAEYENEDSYIRISVPRSTLQSPHRIKPHRRKSFDSTDTVSLSKVLQQHSLENRKILWFDDTVFPYICELE